MDSLEYTLCRFEREYLDLHDVSRLRRVEQLRLLRKFAASLDHPITELTSADLRAFVGGMVRDGLNPTTGTKYMGMLRSFITWAYEAGLIDHQRRNELSLVGNPRGGRWKNRPNPYAAEEIADFYALLQGSLPLLPRYGKGSQMLRSYQLGRAKTLRGGLWRHARRLQFEAQVALALDAGLRRVEIHRLSLGALHPDNAEIVVLTAKQGPGGRAVRRAIPYTDHARYWVAQWLDFRRALGVTHTKPWLTLDIYGSLGRQLDPLDVERMGRSFERQFHTKHWRWHRFRHTAATEWLRAGVPLEKVQYFMGHHSLEQTLAYAQVLKQDVSEAFGAAEASFAQRLGLIVPVDEEEAA